jgi:hypothetical protein
MTGGHHADPAGGADVAAALNELLEAERAGARVALASRDAPGSAAQRALLRAVHADEARWCAMLTEQIERLGAIPSERCGAFYEKAMAIADPVERLHFLNRGQAWVVRRLEALIPRVQEATLQAALAEMLASHRANIDRTTDVLPG